MIALQKSTVNVLVKYNISNYNVYLKKCNLYQIHGGCPVFYIQYTQFIDYLEIFQEKKRLFLPFHFAEALAKTRRLLWQMSGFTGTYKSKKGGNK